VTDAGEQLYLEMPTASYRAGCSQFVIQVVLPQLGQIPGAACELDEVRGRVECWLHRIRCGRHVVICVNYMPDWHLLLTALAFQIPEWCSVRNIYRDIDDLARQNFYLQTGVREHHALHDACANRFAFRRMPDRQFDIDAKRTLSEMPIVFTTADISVMPVEAARSLVDGWCRNGYALNAGRFIDVGVYYNLGRCPDLTSDERIQALLIRHPEAVLTGVSVLHALGWITQRPVQLHVAALHVVRPDALCGFHMWARSAEWFRTVANLSTGSCALGRIYGLTSLHPIVALADLYADPASWHPDWDDLELDEIDPKLLSFVFESFGASAPEELVCLLAKLQPSGDKG